MPRSIIVVNKPARWPFSIPDVEVIAARDYLNNRDWADQKNLRVFNLCRSYSYQNTGYYVSLLAEARGHRPMPQVGTLQDLRHQSLLKVVSAELDSLIQDSLKRLQGDEFTLSIYFARNLARRYEKLSRALFNLFPSPLIRAHFLRVEDRWTLRRLTPISANEIPENHHAFVVDAGTRYFRRGPAKAAHRKPARYELAILCGTDDPTPPSDAEAIEHFVAAARRHEIGTEIIDRDDYGRLAEFDGLFIRETTSVVNHTYRFARRAEAEDMAVMDDPGSIVRCTNKVYLAELLDRHDIPTPRTEIIHTGNVKEVLAILGLPCVLKAPDSSFSLGVIKVNTAEGYQTEVERLLEESDLLIAQEYLRTDFDWRIGVLDKKALYACKYFMARGHWQIYNHAAAKGDGFSGGFETVPLADVPSRVLKTAVRAANLIGDGLYGVDLKYCAGRPAVIEVNDNPSIEGGVEDGELGPGLYDCIMASFLRRMEAKRR
jgi:glutathione synthase/RimK-type ligase-like ATP-grasp enzyme